MSLITFIWGTKTAKTVTIGFGAVAAIAGAITSVNAALPIIEPWWYASRHYARHIAGETKLAFEPTRSAVIDLQIDSAWSRRSAVDDSRARWELQLPKAVTDDERLRIRSQIRDLERERSDLDNKLEVLKRLKGP